ncbi:MAG: hypothetical protein KF812_08880 [Fimbriimonadaceae bacterium]|nr:hypothetical protein [Fimbriimonadaceae bacterium]
MVFALLLAQASSISPTEYFPTETGWRWTYREDAGTTATEVVDVAKGPREQLGRTINTFETLVRGVSQGEIGYNISGSDVQIAWTSGSDPLSTPYTILRVPEGNEATWSFDGGVPTGETMVERLQIKGKAKRIGPQKVLDFEVSDALEVTLDMRLGSGDIVTQIVQVSIYGKGVGLIQMKETTRLGRQTGQRTRVLTALTRPRS